MNHLFVLARNCIALCYIIVIRVARGSLEWLNDKNDAYELLIICLCCKKLYYLLMCFMHFALRVRLLKKNAMFVEVSKW